MTYITPDWVALEHEAATYWPRPTQGPRFIGGWGFRGEVLPLLSEAPLPPLALKVTHTVPAPKPVPVPPLITTSPFEQDYQDARGPGLIPGTTKNLQGLGDAFGPPTRNDGSIAQALALKTQAGPTGWQQALIDAANPALQARPPAPPIPPEQDPWYNSRGTWMAAGGAGLLGIALLWWLKSRR